MTRTFLATLAMAVCLVGCDKSATESNKAVISPGPGVTTAPPAEAKPATPAPAPTPAATPAPAESSDMKTTASGLKYQVLKHGDCTASPKPTDTVKVHYH